MNHQFDCQKNCKTEALKKSICFTLSLMQQLIIRKQNQKKKNDLLVANTVDCFKNVFLKQKRFRVLLIAFRCLRDSVIVPSFGINKLVLRIIPCLSQLIRFIFLPILSVCFYRMINSKIPIENTVSEDCIAPFL